MVMSQPMRPRRIAQAFSVRPNWAEMAAIDAPFEKSPKSKASSCLLHGRFLFGTSEYDIAGSFCSYSNGPIFTAEKQQIFAAEKQQTLAAGKQQIFAAGELE